MLRLILASALEAAAQWLRQRGGCAYSFVLHDAPARRCGLPVDPRCGEDSSLCYWHCACPSVRGEKQHPNGPTRELLQAAVQSGAYLEGAYLFGASLTGALIHRARLPRAVLVKVCLLCGNGPAQMTVRDSPG